jgi:hypothetical protein
MLAQPKGIDAQVSGARQQTTLTPPLSVVEQVSRGLVLVAALAVTIAPAFGWFGIGPQKELHSLEWTDHARFHVMTQGIATVAFGSMAILGALCWWSRGHLVRRIIAAVPATLLASEIASFFVACPLRGVANADAADPARAGSCPGGSVDRRPVKPMDPNWLVPERLKTTVMLPLLSGHAAG